MHGIIAITALASEPGRETSPGSRTPARRRDLAELVQEQARVAVIALVPDLDMAGARGSAIAARVALLASG